MWCLLCVAAMVIDPGLQTVYFHWIWISLAMISGFHLWGFKKAAIATACIAPITTVALMAPAGPAAASPIEVTEVPLMAAVYAAMVWHARRRQAAMDELSDTRARERDFVRDAAHELRTPITIARGHTELIRDALPSGSQTRADSETVLAELLRLSRMTDRLLMLASADHADFLSLAPLSPARLLNETARRWSVADGRHVDVEIAMDGVIIADEERLRTALDALIENAFKVTGPGDHVTLVARTEGGSAVLEVLDDGPGIAPENQELIFDRFRRPIESRTGTGLGLPIVRAIAEAHGGTATLRSALGQGTTFSLRLGPVEQPQKLLLREPAIV